ncbi:MAG: PAC2 family protein [Canibacter sp.]
MSKSLISTQSQELRDETPRGLPLVVTIPGLTDAGSSVAGLNEFIWNSADPQVIIRFSNDDLLDYRARRPLITLQDETLIDYEAEELVLAVAHDQLGSQFLHLSGFEPDYRWEAFIDEVLGLVDEFEVAHTSIFHAIPMPVPHRRPVQFTLSGTREDLISHNSTWKPTTRIAASVTNLLEYRLAQLDDDVMSWAAMVPHYLAGSDYPTGVLGLISAMSKSTGLIFDTDQVRKRSETFLDAVDAQIAESPENLEQIQELENRFDQYQHDTAAREDLLGKEGIIPSAEELAGEFERFLATNIQTDDDENDSPE